MNHNLIARLNALEPEAAEKLGDALDRVSPALCLRISREIRQRMEREVR